MKKSKKFLKVLSVSAIAAMMAAAMVPTAAFAADLDTTTKQYYTLPSATDGVTYRVYKVATATVDGEAYAYEVNSKALNDTKGFETIITNGTDENEGNLMYKNAVITSTDASTAQALAKDLAGVIADETAIKSVASTDTDRTIDLTAGYYLITASSSTVSPILLSVRSDDNHTTTETALKLEAKTNDITVDKSIESIGGGTISSDKNKGQGAIGSTIEYKITTTVPKYASNVNKLSHSFTIVDTPEAGIKISTTINGDVTTPNVTVNVGGKDESPASNTYTLTYDAATGGFTVTFNDDYTLAHQDEAVVITFNAEIDEDATTGSDENSNDNTVTLTYDNDYTTTGAADPDGDHKGKETDIVLIFTSELDVTKTFDGQSSDGDKTATFTLYTYDSDTETTVNEIDSLPTSSDDNTLEFKGLAAGTYILKEKNVPDGYKAADDVIFTISADMTNSFNGAFTFDNANITVTGGIGATEIDNIPGQMLPGTGGIGTTIFTVAGLGTIVIAGAALTVYLKKRRTEEE